MRIRKLEISGLENMGRGMSICYNKVINTTSPKRDPLKVGASHTTVLRFVNVTIELEGISMRAANQIRTHRSLNCLTTSTQYVNHKDTDFVLEYDCDNDTIVLLGQIVLFTQFRDKNKSAIVLPQSIQRSIIFSCDLHYLYYIIKLRTEPGNIQEIQDIFYSILYALPQELQEGYEHYKECDYRN